MSVDAPAAQERPVAIAPVPADQEGDAAVARVEAAKSQVAGSEVEVFEIERVVWDVHLAKDPEERAAGVDDGGRVVIDARGAPLKKGRGDDHTQFGGQTAERAGGGIGDGLVGAGHLDEADAELGGVHVSILAEWGRVRWGSRREPGLGLGLCSSLGADCALLGVFVLGWWATRNLPSRVISRKWGRNPMYLVIVTELG